MQVREREGYLACKAVEGEMKLYKIDEVGTYATRDGPYEDREGVAGAPPESGVHVDCGKMEDGEGGEETHRDRNGIIEHLSRESIQQEPCNTTPSS